MSDPVRTYPDIYYSGQLSYLCVDSLSQDPAQAMPAAAFSKIHIFAGKNSQFITFLQVFEPFVTLFAGLLIALPPVRLSTLAKCVVRYFSATQQVYGLEPGLPLYS